jgi:hypothetical protein
MLFGFGKGLVTRQMTIRHNYATTHIEGCSH